MALDLQTAKRNLLKAKQDVEYWEQAVRLLSDPRAMGSEAAPVAPSRNGSIIIDNHVPLPAPRAPYGDLKRRVLEQLPPLGDSPVTTSRIVELMEAGGYTFASKTPTISVNEALVTLEKEGLSYVAAQLGVTKHWTKASKRQEAPGGAS